MDSLTSLSDSVAALAALASAKLFHVPSSMGGRTALGFDGKHLLVPAFDASVGEELSILAPGGKEAEAKVAGFDAALGLAVLELSQEYPESAWLAEAGLPALGSLVLVAAFPSPEGPEVRLDALRFAGGEGERAYLQTDGANFPGFAGAAIVDPAGRLAGFLLADRGGNRGWALPAFRAVELVKDIVSGASSTRAWLGLSTVPVAAPADLADAFGDGRANALLVAGVESESPAASAGLRVGDLLVSLNGRAVVDPSDLMEALGEARPGVELKLLVLRSGEKKELTAIPSARPKDDAREGGYGRRGRWHHQHGAGAWWMGGGRCGWGQGR